MDEIVERRRALRRACLRVIPDFWTPSTAEEFRLMADWCEAQETVHDVYGEGRLVGDFEATIADLLGKPAAVFMPSGVMAQLIAVKVWAERTGAQRFGIHPTSHMAIHEHEAYQAIFRYQGVIIGDALRPLVAADLAAQRQPMDCLVVELPIRESGGQLPSWSELEALKAAAAASGLTLHMDGARLWECAAFYGKTYAEIADGFASVYVSTYKGLGGLAGALLAGPADFVAEARVWRKRMGGGLIHQSPMVVSAAMRLNARLAILGACHDRAMALAEGLAGLDRIRVNPARPQTNLFHLYFDTPSETVLERRDSIAARDGVWTVNGVRPAAVPGWSVTELYVGDNLLGLDNAFVLPRVAALVGEA